MKKLTDGQLRRKRIKFIIVNTVMEEGVPLAYYQPLIDQIDKMIISEVKSATWKLKSAVRESLEKAMKNHKLIAED